MMDDDAMKDIHQTGDDTNGKAVEALEKVLEAVEGQVEVTDWLRGIAKDNRRLIRRLAHVTVALVISLLFDLGLTGVVFHNLFDLNNVTSSTHQNCQFGNVFRAHDEARWLGVVKLSGPPKTPQQAAILNTFVKNLKHDDAQRRC